MTDIAIGQLRMIPKMSQSFAANERHQLMGGLALPEAQHREAAAKRIAWEKSGDERVVSKLQELAASDPYAYVRESAGAALLAVGQTVPAVNVPPRVNKGSNIALIGLSFFVMVAWLMVWSIVSDLAIGYGRVILRESLSDFDVNASTLVGAVGILPLAFVSGFVTQRKKALAKILVIGVLLSGGVGQFFSTLLSREAADPYTSLISANVHLWIPPLAWAGAWILGLVPGFWFNVLRGSVSHSRR